RRDAEYRLELDFCFDHAGIPHSELLSWEPEDRAKVHMWMMEKLLTCECGTRLEEWDKDKGGERRAYVVETFVCPGCAGITEAVDAAHQNAKVSGKSGVPGLKVKLTPKWLVDYRIKNRS